MPSPIAMKPVYTGSVKTVLQDDNQPAISYFRFSDDYSVFDWGKMPDTIPNKGKALALMGGAFFQALGDVDAWQSLPQALALGNLEADYVSSLFQTKTYQTLCKTGLAHHFLGWLTPDGETQDVTEAAQADEPMMKVQTVQVKVPKAFALEQHTLYDYPLVDSTQTRLIPLEVVFRFGMPPGSSLEKRLQEHPDYAAQLGLSRLPQPNSLFERPVIEFFTKLEPTDRFLPLQEGFLTSGVSSQAFQTLTETATLLSLWLGVFFKQHDVQLWDGKFEFAYGPKGLILVDSIGPDELRLTYEGIQLSKEMIRQYYRGSAWEKAVQQAKQLALSQPGVDWKVICQDQLGQSPQPLTSGQKQIVDQVYGSLANALFNANWIKPAMGLDELIQRIQTPGISSEAIV